MIYSRAFEENQFEVFMVDGCLVIAINIKKRKKEKEKKKKKETRL